MGRLFRVVTVGAFVFLVMAGGTAHGDILPVQLGIQAVSGGQIFNIDLSQIDGSIDQDGNFSGSGAIHNDLFDFVWTVNGNLDPVVNLIAALTAGAFDTTFTITSALLSFPTIPSTVTGGYINGTLTDLNQDGATMSAAPGGSIYRSLADGVSYVTLLDDPFTLSVDDDGSAPFSASFGNPIPSLPGPAITDMQLQIRTLLSPHDNIQFEASFVAEPGTPVPEPGTMAMLSLSLGGLAVRNARRKARTASVR